MKNWANNVTNMSKKTHKTKESPSILWRLGDLPSFLFYSLVGHMYSFYVVISTFVYLETNVIEAVSLLFVCFYLFFFSIIVLNSENTYSPKKKEALSWCLWIHCRTLIELGAHFIVKSVSIKKNVTWAREECKWTSSGCVGV